jgi:hypothetical protein
MESHVGAFRPSQSAGRIELGTVGWDGVDEYAFLGSGDNDGYTLVRVQLYRGRDKTKPLKKGVAQGYQIVAQIDSALFYVPPRGTRVYVALPAGMDTTKGAGVIFATVRPSPTIQFASDKSGEPRAVLDFGDETHVVIRGKSVTAQDPQGRHISVGTPRAGGAAGVSAIDETGSGWTIQSGVVGLFATDNGTPPDAKSCIQLTATLIDIMQKGSTLAGAKFASGDATICGNNFYSYTAGCYLGAMATVANTVLWGVSGPAAAPSATVYVSP